MADAARVSDLHTCPLTVPYTHGGGAIAPPGETSVLIGYLPAATHGSICACGLGPLNRVIVSPSRSVVIGYKGAARVGDSTSHGGAIVSGCGTVDIG
ncbi:PAAR motif protein [Enhygromyxa salina]|uniref:PAAR motif protein n=1 Tax=Enhygromyxa salina TaxID=215803 RepID=A0A2S9XCZ6_9BACT|nr:PAAR domain-containing protein [Enhygromyxa salina]PRP90733.1 PAAR motif protein [Enhygromyxa salina]